MFIPLSRIGCVAAILSSGPVVSIV